VSLSLPLPETEEETNLYPTTPISDKEEETNLYLPTPIPEKEEPSPSLFPFTRPSKNPSPRQNNPSIGWCRDKRVYDSPAWTRSQEESIARVKEDELIGRNPINPLHFSTTPENLILKTHPTHVHLSMEIK